MTDLLAETSFLDHFLGDLYPHHAALGGDLDVLSCMFFNVYFIMKPRRLSGKGLVFSF